MPFADFLLRLFCLVDDSLPRRGRRRGRPVATLTDAGVVTVELAGGLLGLDHDKGIVGHFRRYHRADFPALAGRHRTTFARRAAGLYAAKKAVHGRLAARADRERVFLADSRPVEACKLGRAKFCKRLKGDAAFGYEHTRRTTFYGFRLHARATPQGAIVAFDLAPVNVSDLATLADLAPAAGCAVVGDRAYWPPRVAAELADRGVRPVAPFQTKKRDLDPARAWRISRFRWLIETAFGRLAGRLRVKTTWARDLWHLSHRVIRKVLARTAAVWLNVTSGRKPLDFDGLLNG